MRKLIDLNDGQQIERGMWPSLDSNQAELWRDGKNVEFHARKAAKAEGVMRQGTTDTPVLAVQQMFQEGTRRVYFAIQDKVYKYEAGVTTLLGYGFGGVGNWCLETWGKWLLATNEFDAPKLWKDVDVAVDLADFISYNNPTARLLKKHKNHMMAYFDQTVAWSKDSDVEVWTAAVNNSAGSQFLRDISSEIIAACPLGQAFGLYTSNELVVQQYIGEPFFFSFNPAIEGIGAFSDSAVIPMGNRNYGLGSKGAWLTDGISFEYVDTPQINDWIFERINLAASRRVVGLHHESDSSIHWWFPCLDGITRGVSFNHEKRAWGILEQEVYAAVPKSVFADPIAGGPDGWGFIKGANFFGEAMEAQLTTFPLDGGQRENYKQWDMYRADVVGTGLEVRFGYQDTLRDDDGADVEPEWGDWEPLKRENWIRRESVFITVDIRSTALDAEWALTGFSIHGEVTGEL